MFKMQTATVFGVFNSDLKPNHSNQLLAQGKSKIGQLT